MRVMIIATDPLSQSLLCRCCREFEDVQPLGPFSEPGRALQASREQPVDLALLELSQPPELWLTLAHQLRREHPRLMLLLFAAGEEFAMEALQLHAVGYLVKPLKKEALMETLTLSRQLCGFFTPKRVHIRTFGHFDVFVDGKPLCFSRQKSKELLAYLVDRRGGTATMEQIICDLWEERALDSAVRASYQAALSGLRKSLREAGISELLNNQRNQKSLNLQMVDCDCYRLLEGDPQALEDYRYEYMSDYSWAEPTNAHCASIKERAELQEESKKN